MVQIKSNYPSDLDESDSYPEPDVLSITTRNGRRESEPHSNEVVQLHEVLTYNFPQHRTLWDLHHFFINTDQEEFDLQFDISILKNFSISHELTSYKASEFGNRVPDLAINVLSRSTWRKDLFDIAEESLILGIPIYLVYTPYHVATNRYRAPFMRMHKMNEKGKYDVVDIRKAACVEGDPAVSADALISLEPIFPLIVGLELLKKVTNDNKHRFRLVLFKCDSMERLLTEKEATKKRAEEEKKRAEEEKKRADKYEILLKKHNISIDE